MQSAEMLLEWFGFKRKSDLLLVQGVVLQKKTAGSVSAA